MHLIIICVLTAWHVSIAVCQRYAERNPLPMDTLPFDDAYDYEYTENYYGFSEDKEIFRWNVRDFPHPQKQHRFCNRMKPSFVCDPDQVLEKDQADKLDSYILQLYNETLCICDDCTTRNGGIVVGIGLLKYMFQPYNQHPSKTIRAFTEAIRQDWKLGSCDNDILIVVATTDRLSYTDVGKATSPYMSLKEAHTIFLENKGNFSTGHFFEGLSAILADYHKKTRDMKVPVKEELNIGLISGIIVGAVVLLGIILFLTFVIFKYCRKRNKDPEKSSDEGDHKSEGVSSSWTKQDIKVMFSSLKGPSSKPQTLSQSTKYQVCETEDKELTNNFTIDEEVIDTTLALPVSPDTTQGNTTTTSGDTSTSELLEKEMLDKELEVAVESLAPTFQTFQPKREFRGHETDL